MFDNVRTLNESIVILAGYSPSRRVCGAVLGCSTGAKEETRYLQQDTDQMYLHTRYCVDVYLDTRYCVDIYLDTIHTRNCVDISMH